MMLQKGRFCSECNLDEISNKETVRLYDWKHSFIGLYEFKDDRKDFKPVKIFME